MIPHYLRWYPLNHQKQWRNRRRNEALWRALFVTMWIQQEKCYAPLYLDQVNNTLTACSFNSRWKPVGRHVRIKDRRVYEKGYVLFVWSLFTLSLQLPALCYPLVSTVLPMRRVGFKSFFKEKKPYVCVNRCKHFIPRKIFFWFIFLFLLIMTINIDYIVLSLALFYPCVWQASNPFWKRKDTTLV